MKVVYIAGPFRAKTPWEVEQNVRRAEEFGLKIAELGGMPLIPHACTRFFNGLLTEQFWVDGTAELLRRCDTMALVPGNWRSSSGTLDEIELAHELKLPVFDVELGDGEQWSMLVDFLK